jgi:branched-subunit amino acid transport protein
MTSTLPTSPFQFWVIIIALAIGTYLIRLSFLGLIGDRTLPLWLLRILRFTPVAVLPAIAIPMVIGSDIADVDPVRIIAAFTTLGVGLATRNVLYAIIAGLSVFFGVNAL